MKNNKNNSIDSKGESYNFRTQPWRQFKKNKSAYFSLYIILSLFIVALLSPFLANHQPLMVTVYNQNLYPAFTTFFNESKVDTITYHDAAGEERLQVIQYNEMDWRSVKKEFVIWAPIPYSANYSDKYNRDFSSPMGDQRYRDSKGNITKIPGRLRHFLGTDKLGRDLAAGIVYGSRISLLVGIFSMLIAALIGIPLGAFAGYYGNEEIQVKRLQFWFGLIGLCIGLFIAFVGRSYDLKIAFDEGIGSGFLMLLAHILIPIACLIIFSFLGKKLAFGRFLSSKVNVPIDALVSRSIEVLNSLPALILIITIAAVINERSISVLVFIIGFTSWTGIARFMRAELLKIKQMEYIQTAKALGYSNSRIIFGHALPNGIAPVFITIAFGIASAILVESGLSFLGIGVPDDVVTWGNLLSLGREEFEASWLVIFPGLAIFITVTAYNLIGEGLRNALDPKQNN